MGPALFALPLFLPQPLALAELHVDDRRGFQIEVPEQWQKFEQETEAEGFSLHLLPPGSLGERGVTVVVRELEDGEGIEAVMTRANAHASELGATSIESWDSQLGGKPSPGLTVLLDSQMGELRVQVSYAVRGGLSYAVQRSAKASEYDATAESLAAVVETLEFKAPIGRQDSGGEAGPSLDELIERLGNRVTWAADWETAVARARAESKPILVVAFMYSGFNLEQTPRTSVFSEESIVELVQERFVPFDFTTGVDAGFTAGYGLSRTTFGQGLLVVSPEGEVLLETQHATDPDLAYQFMRDALARLPQFKATPVPDNVGPIDRARIHVARGELERALGILESPLNAKSWEIRAKALRLSRRGEEALAALAKARAMGSHTPSISLDEAELHLRLGNREEARKALGAISDQSGAEAQARARLLSGLLHVQAGDVEAAKTEWRSAVEQNASSHWAAQCAAALRSDWIDQGIRPDFAWPSEFVLEEMRAFPVDSAPRARTDVARKEGVAWLLDHQLADGSWGSFSNGDAQPEHGPDPFNDSATALAVRALLRHRDFPGAEAAARRAVAYLQGSVRARDETPPRVFYMDYMTWSNAMMLEAIVDATEAGLIATGDMRGTVGTLVRDLARRQAEGGGWSYYITGDLSSESAMPPHCMSFTTAAGAIALARTKATGYTVSENVLSPAVQALEDMRESDGVFPYFYFHDVEGSALALGLEGEVGRGPACELALFLNGKSDAERLAGAVELFLEHAPSYAAERGKVLMHAGPQGQGCHYLFFDYAHAALVAERLPKNAETQARLLELVLDARQPDGAFLDTPILGRPYGTAMALIALSALDG